MNAVPVVVSGVLVPDPLVRQLAAVVRAGCVVLAGELRRQGAELPREVLDLRDLLDLRAAAVAPVAASASDVGGVSGRDSEAPAGSSHEVSSKELAAALWLGVRHAQDVARASGLVPRRVGRSLLWDGAAVTALVRARGAA